MTAEKLRERARASIKDQYGDAILATLIASFLGASIPACGWTLCNLVNGDMPMGTACGVITLVLGGAMNLGLITYYQKLYNGEKASLSDLVGSFDHFGSALVLNLLVYVFVILWSLLLIVPGIVMSYAYSQAFFIMKDHPDMDPMDALNESKKLMDGKKWDLFCLDLSFLGWAILSLLTAGIGFLLLNPYMTAARMAFYKEITGQASEAPNQPDQPDQPIQLPGSVSGT